MDDIKGRYVFDGKTPLCTDNLFGIQFPCPPGIRLEILDQASLREAAIGAQMKKPIACTFEITISSSINLPVTMANRVKSENNGYDIPKANIFVCIHKDEAICQPYLDDYKTDSNSAEFVSSSLIQSADLDMEDQVALTQNFFLSESGVYQIVVRAEFALDKDFLGVPSNSSFYTAASVIILTRDKGPSNSMVGILGIIGVLLTVAVCLGAVLFKRRGRALRRSVRQRNRQPDQMIISSGINMTSSLFKLKSEGTRNSSGFFQDGKTETTCSSGYNSNLDMSSLTESATIAHEFIKTKPTGDEVLYDMLYSNDNFMISNIESKKIKVGDVLGSGSFGEVLKGEYSSSYVAIKRMHPFMPQGEADSFVKEIKLLMSLRHPNIVQFIGTSWINGFGLCAVTEYMERGDLTTVLKNKDGIDLSWNKLKMSMAIDMILSLAYLHGLDPPVIHRDLKSRNVLVTENFCAKLSDFGLSRSISMDETMTCVGSNLWLPPEMIRGDAFDEMADIFSFGVVLTELDTQKLPYHDSVGAKGQRLGGVALTHQVAFKNVRPTFTEHCPAKLKELAEWCMRSDPTTRPRPQEIISALRDLKSELASYDDFEITF